MATKRVYVYEYDPAGELHVWPPARVVEKGDEVEIVNTTDSPIEWNHEDGDVYGEPIDKLKVKKKDRSPKMKVKAKGPLARPYTVERAQEKGRKRKKRAIASDFSDPVIIIET